MMNDKERAYYMDLARRNYYAPKVQSKPFEEEAKKAFLQQARIRIAEHRARMEERAHKEELARKADPMAATSSSTASPAKPNFNLMVELPKSSSPADENLNKKHNNDDQIKPAEDENLNKKHNSDDQIKPAPDENSNKKHNSDDQIKPVWVPPPTGPVLGVYTETDRCVYNSRNPDFNKSRVPAYIKEYCTLALQKYNDEEGTNYRYVCPLRAHEWAKEREITHFFIFRASQSDSDSDSEIFKTTVKIGVRFSKGKYSSFKEVEQAGRVLRKYGW